MDDVGRLIAFGLAGCAVATILCLGAAALSADPRLYASMLSDPGSLLWLPASVGGLAGIALGVLLEARK